ncbi:MAG: pentapeptide repeat-containing protein [bacterium]|nr:MAG: pentapeptide repeat-containing protein [bacterium]
MNWPTISDYQEAIQNPGVCFQPLELRSGQIGLNPVGLPKVATGNFASVYQLTSGVQRWAIRCFLKQTTDQQRRYQLLGQQLSSSRLPGLVDFEYLPQAILVKNQLYPVLRMTWIEGNTLNQFVEESINNPSQLLDIAAKWRNLISNLQANRLAHGDLEHRNIIVTPQNSLYLVDYDTVFIPSLRGEKSPDLGNENFQNPKRTLDNYDEKIDSFSALVTYLSLLALAYQPNLWQQFYQGENLLFTRKDYLNPYQSSLFYQLKNSSNEGVRQLAGILENICLSPTVTVPDFEALVASLSISNNLQTLPNQGVNTLPETRVAPLNNLQNQPLPLPSWQGTPSQINPIAQGQINPSFQAPVNNVFNPIAIPGQIQGIQQGITKTKSPLWLKLLAIASSVVAFISISFSIYQIYSYEKKISYLESDISYYNGQLSTEREKITKLEQELAQEKELRETTSISKSQKDIAAIMAKTFLGSKEIKKLNAKVDSIKFYEGGTEGTLRDSRVYSNTFTTGSRFVYWELNLTHPTRSYKDNFQIQHVWYKDNQEWARGTLNTFLEPIWGTSYHNDGRGWPQSYKWSPGDYRVELFVDGEKITYSVFTITQ